MSQRLLYPELALYALLVYVLLIWSTQQELWWASVSATLLASSMLMVVLRVWLEKGFDDKLVDLRKGSWSALIGDTFVLTTAFGFCAVAWQFVPKTEFFVSGYWMFGCLIAGFAAGLGFHAWDSGNYVRDGAELALYSPTKLGHDFVAYPVLFGGLLCVGVPVLWHWSGYSWIVIACVVIHVILMIADGIRGAKGLLRPVNLHPPSWSVAHFRVM